LWNELGVVVDGGFIVFADLIIWGKISGFSLKKSSNVGFSM